MLFIDENVVKKMRIKMTRWFTFFNSKRKKMKDPNSPLLPVTVKAPFLSHIQTSLMYTK